MLAGQIPCDQFNCLLTEYYSMITYLNGNIWKLVKVARIIDGPDGDRDDSWPLPDVAPVHVLEPVQGHDLLLALHPTISIITKPKKLHILSWSSCTYIHCNTFG